MAAHFRPIKIPRRIRLEDYRGLEHLRAPLDEAAKLGAEVGHLLGTRRVWMLSSTESGGGVAEMMPPLCSLLNDVHVDTRWVVLQPEDPRFFVGTKALHNIVHGRPPDAPLDELRSVYERVSVEAAQSLRAFVESGDVVVVHDPQPVGAAFHLLRELHPLLIWRCHIGIPHGSPHARAAWRFLEPYLQPFQRLLFSSERYVPPELQPRAGVVQPGIDPLSHKNRELRMYKLVGVLRSAGLVAGPEPPPWARFEGVAARYVGGAWTETPVENILFAPVYLQVSRFDRFKGFHSLIPAFAHLLEHGSEWASRTRADTARIENELEQSLLLLAGPDPVGVIDDPEAEGVLEDLCNQWDKLPREVAARVHLLRLPMVNKKQNALAVNALQRVASVVVQSSVEEGFGLTVTEAMWKGVPLVASNVGGISMQVRPGTDGLLVDHPHDPKQLASAMFEQLALRARAESMAQSGRARVGEHFLIVHQLVRWLEELRDGLQARAVADKNLPSPTARAHRAALTPARVGHRPSH